MCGRCMEGVEHACTAPTQPTEDFLCEDCEHMFTALEGAPSPRCPECGGSNTSPGVVMPANSEVR